MASTTLQPSLPPFYYILIFTYQTKNLAKMWKMHECDERLWKDTEQRKARKKLGYISQ